MANQPPNKPTGISSHNMKAVQDPPLNPESGRMDTLRVIRAWDASCEVLKEVVQVVEASISDNEKTRETSLTTRKIVLAAAGVGALAFLCILTIVGVQSVAINEIRNEIHELKSK